MTKIVLLDVLDSFSTRYKMEQPFIVSTISVVILTISLVISLHNVQGQYRKKSINHF